MESQKLEFFKFSALFLTALLASAAAAASISPAKVEIPKIEVPLSPVEEGNAFFVSVQVPEHTKSVEAFFNDRVVEFYPDGKSPDGSEKFTGFLGIEIGAKEGKAEMLVKIRVAVPSKREQTIQKKVDVEIKKGIFAQESITVKDDQVEPRTRAQKRQIAKDSAFLARIYSQSLQKKMWESPLKLPVESIVTGPFGTSRLYKGTKDKKVQKLGYHRGTDLRAHNKTPIMAPLAGKVVAARYLYFTGNTVILDHGYGFFSIYAHMTSLNVSEEGAKVKSGKKELRHFVDRGDQLGLSGHTGRVMAPHLHWGVKLNGVMVNPMQVAELLKK